MNNINHGSLFTGFGGFDLAAHWNNWNNVFQCEKDRYCKKLLTQNFPLTNLYDNIYEFKAKQYYGTIDIISGGFPCQPFSVAGNRNGKNDDRYLWKEMYRIIREVKPPFVVCENVTGIISMALDDVLSDLENIGYTTEAFVIPACGKNALHKRERVWIISYANYIANYRINGKLPSKSEKKWIQKRQQMELSFKPNSLQFLSNPISIGSNQSKSGNASKLINENGSNRQIVTHANGKLQQKQLLAITNKTENYAPRCDSWWKTEPGMGRVVDGVPHRVDRIKGLGNAIVPQIADEIFKSITTIINETYPKFGIYNDLPTKNI